MNNDNFEFDDEEDDVPDGSGQAWYARFVHPTDFTFITPNLAVGGQISTLADVARLKAAGVTNVINVQQEFNDRKLLGSIPGIWLPVPDDLQRKPLGWWKAGIDYGKEVLAQPGRILYVHCFAGINRSVGMTYAILRATGVSRSAAAMMILRKRPVARPTYFAFAEEALAVLA